MIINSFNIILKNGKKTKCLYSKLESFLNFLIADGNGKLLIFGNKKLKHQEKGTF